MKYFLIIVFCTYALSSFAQENKKEYTILLLSTDGFSYPYTQLFTKGFEEEFKRQGIKTVFIYESLNLYLFSENKEEYYRSLVSSFEMKYKHRHPDLVMAVEISSAEFLLKYGDKFIANTPVVTAGTSELNQIINKPNWHQIMDTLDVREMFASIKKTLPHTKKVTVIIGDSEYEKGIVDWYKRKTKQLSIALEIEYTQNKSSEELFEIVQNPKPNEVFYYLYYFEDKNGKKSIPAKILSDIDKKAKAPVFVYAENFVKGKNVIGGYVFSTRKFGTVSAQKCIKVLKNPDTTFSLLKIVSNKHVYNWTGLKKYNISEEKLPENSTILYKEFTVWDLYWHYILFALFLILIQTLLIISLFKNIKKRRKAENRIIEINKNLEKTVEKQVSQIKTQNAVLEKNVNQMKALQQFKGKMINMIAHDLKNPLNFIINNNENTNTTKSTNETKEAAKQMLNLVCNMLEIYKIRTNKFEILTKQNFLFGIIKTAIAETKYQAERKDIEIIADFNVEPIVEVDKNSIIRVFVNLLLNAIRFSPMNGVISISIKMNENKKEVTISISDNGKGIDPKFQHTIFEPFAQVQEGDKQLGTTGLGLAFCKTAIESHNGKIELDRNYKNGAKFDVTLNYLRTEKSKTKDAENKQRNTILLSKKEKIFFNTVFEENNKPDIFEATAWRRIFNIIEEAKSINKAWLDDMKKTVLQCNIEKFHKMINNLKEL